MRHQRLSRIAERLYNHKKNIYSSLKEIHPVAISPWVKEWTQKSGIFGNNPIREIWNCVYLNDFESIKKSDARKGLGLKEDVIWLCIGSVSISDEHKGLSLLKKALNLLIRDQASPRVGLLVFGKGRFLDPPEEVEVKEFGFVSDFNTLSKIYSASDVFLMPSTWESFGKTIVEAWACGRPVVCFDHSGPGSLVDHKVNGYKAKAFEPEDFANGIRFIFSNLDNFPYDKMVKKSNEFGHVEAARTYLKLYSDIAIGS